MVFGISEGEIDISLKTTRFYPGQEITGKVTLKLPKPKDARALRIAFYGEMPGTDKYRKVRRIFEVNKVLAEERTFNDKDSFDFSLTIPENCIPASVGFYESIMNTFSSRPNGWFVHAWLDVPLELDINKRMKIDMVPKPAGL